MEFKFFTLDGKKPYFFHEELLSWWQMDQISKVTQVDSEDEMGNVI
jgi:bacterioferritin (cytochrome b1)